MPYKDFNPDSKDFTSPAPNVFERLTARPRLAFANYAEGLDLSHWRPDLDLQLAINQDIKFIITKATQGDYFVDEWYQPYRDQAKALNLPFTGFHYWDAAIKPIDQAKYYDSHAGYDHELLDVLDVEKYGNQGILTQDSAAQSIHDTAQEMQQIRGREVMIYTSLNMWEVLTGNSPIIAAYPLWVAHWTTAAQPILPHGATEWVLWQYTNKFAIPGAPNTGYDANRFNGNEAEFAAYLKSINGSLGGECCDELLLRVEDVEQVNKKQNTRISKQHARITELERIAVQIGEDFSEIIEHQDKRITELERIAEQLKGIK